MKQRLTSLDFFRGFTMMIMIIVNSPGDWGFVYAPLLHAHWNGFTMTDAVFPAFIFMVGVSSALSLDKIKQQSNVRLGIVLRKTFNRSVRLVVLGILLGAFPFVDIELSAIRIPGVLQRIGVVFFCLVFLYLNFNFKQILLLSVLLLSSYYILWVYETSSWMVVLENNADHIAAKVDQWVFGNHVWKYSKPLDPEGLLSTIPATVSGIIGMLIGMKFLKESPSLKIFTQLGILGVSLVVCGSLWGIVFPINKTLWTSSFVLYAAGWSVLFFTFAYWLLDIAKLKSVFFKLSIAFGKNAIVAYVLAAIIESLAYLIMVNDVSLKTIVFNFLSSLGLGLYNASFAYALLLLVLIAIPIVILDRKSKYIKI